MSNKKVILYSADSDNYARQNGRHDGWNPSFFKYFTPVSTIPSTKFYYLIDYLKYQLDATSIKLSADILDRVQNGTCLILLVCTTEGYPWNAYSKFIDTLCTNYNLSSKNVVIMSNNPIESPVGYNSVFYNFWEYFSFSKNILQEHKRGQDAVLSQKPRPYRFIALNRRCHAHRMAAFTKLYPYKDLGLLSFAKAGYSQKDLAPTYNYYNCQRGLFKEHFPRIFNEWNFEQLDTVVPFELDKELDPYDHISLDTNPIHDEYNLKFYQSYLHIVIETYISSMFFSEKTFKPIKYFQPFVMINAAGSLKKLKELGYRTFENYIDEGYDDIVNDQDRIEYAIKSAVEFMMQDNLPAILKDMFPILKHNHKILYYNSMNTLRRLEYNLNTILNTTAINKEEL